MRVYLAAPYEARLLARSAAQELEQIGFFVTSSWLTETHEINAGTTGPAKDLTEAEVRGHCVNDFLDVDRAEVLVVWTAQEAGVLGGSGGRHVETGYALAQKKPVFVVGPAENVFHRGVCTVTADWHQLVLALVEHRRAVEGEAA